MRRAAVIACVVMLISAAAAEARPVDTTSAHKGLRALRAYLSATTRLTGAATRSDDAFIAGIQSTCSNVLASVSSSDTFDQGVVVQFGKEASADLVAAAFVPARKPLAVLRRRVSKLRWSRQSTKRAVQAALDAQDTVFKLPPSDLCADASALAANGGRAVPSGTKTFLKTFQRDASLAGLDGLEEVLVRYRPARDMRLVREVNRLSERADKRLEHVFDREVRKLLKVLALFV
jgi:hypothetical protein